MSVPLSAQDLWPLVQKLPHAEQVRLVKLALMAASRDPAADADAYRVTPPGPDELVCADDPLAWEAEGWEKLDTPE